MLKGLFQQESVQDALIRQGLVTSEQLEEAIEEVGSDKSEFEAIIETFQDNSAIFSAMAEFAKVKTVELLGLQKIESSVLDEIPRQVVASDNVMPFGYEDDAQSVIKVGMSDPTNSQLIENLSLRSNKSISPYLARPKDIEKMISRYYGDAAALEAASEYASKYGRAEVTKVDDFASGNSPIITIVNSIIEQAARMDASDIHIEPFETKLKVRYRIDGVCVERPSFEKNMAPAVIARVKIMSGMDIAEKRIPQDGRITYDIDGVEYDIRVSTLPTVYGEKCVMRLQVRKNLSRDKRDLGLTDYDLKIFDKVFANPNGIVLVTGPTGSGKSTTLYTVLSELSTDEVNIVTVEDPVEANIDGVNQVQTNVRAGLTFASALRSILRQDPDIIMIGEIRDEETAQIAVQAAITGHLVVSTVHTNSSAATVSRLINMGIPSYLVADSVVGIMAQRLIRKLCPKCKKERLATPDELVELGIKKGVNGVKIYDKCGCAFCNNTGYSGRTAVYEIMDINGELRHLIAIDAATEDIKQCAIKNGMRSLHRSASEMVVRGITTMSEMRKVSNEW